MTITTTQPKPNQRLIHLVCMGICLALAAWLYFDLTAWEQEGGTKSMHKVVALLYDIGGIKGVVGGFSLLAAFFGVQAIRAKT